MCTLRFVNVVFVCPRHVVCGALAITSYLSSDRTVVHQWFLPPTFAVDVLSNVPEDEIKRKYQGGWMPETDQLQRVFIPILDRGTWFMMLIDIKPWRVYALDVSRTQEFERRRECFMHKILKFMGGFV
ncbi:hypothetical protein PIB30_026369 [Stylosanthes scabra]|uniref:Uncharacterized protein n=1 Tax=Stylosanthes scabra TaxID=79078 RepID=A0ABU6Q9T8_9FABA|nr:hypothetical protein [Stylosanthes scabra]